MVLFTLINVSLDISTNIAWWITKNTLYGTYCLITYIRPPKPTKEEIELIELKNLISQLNNKIHIMYDIKNNPNIISRNNLIIKNKLSEEQFELSLLDDFIIINNDNQISEIS
jgi:hypothetical protein